MSEATSCHYTNPPDSLKFLNWSSNAPIFPLESNKIEVLLQPKQFFDQLKELSLKSKSRITISSLYLGTDKREQELISCLESNQNANKSLNVSILLDYNRATRLNADKESSKSVLMPLVKNGANVAFYLTPQMSGWREWIVHDRAKWNELISLHHIKCYIFDDTLILSGANLNDQYFTNRQDRYIVFHDCKHLCDYFDQLVKTIITFSLNVSHNGDLNLHPSWSIHPLSSSLSSQFCEQAKQRLNKLKEKFQIAHSYNAKDNPVTTFALPLLQFKPFGIEDDENFTAHILAHAGPNETIKLATGYFNLTERYKSILLNRKSNTNCDILLASERANGFFGAKGVAGNIPFVYSHLTRDFLRQVKLLNSKIMLHSYMRPQWTFHAKGLWLSWNSTLLLSMIGSPNFGYRSVYRDNEATLVLVTNDDKLKDKLNNEYQHLSKHSQPIEREDQIMTIPFWVSMVAKAFKSFY